jgi:protein O-GlcNAcase/histone acetyltransferase
MTSEATGREASSGWSAGVIEGFYGPPWTQAEREQLLDWMARFGLTTYLHAPKDDPHHRAVWRRPLPPAAVADLADLVDACRRRGIAFVWAIHPALDIRYSSADDLAALMARLEQVAAVGGRDFAILFDDVPGTLVPEDAGAFGSLAAAQAHVANRVHEWLRGRDTAGRMLICPTAYCTRMADAGLGGAGYLRELGERLAPAIDVLWTGPEIVSREITVDHLTGVASLLRRPPVLWDNLFANDYDIGRFFAGPFAGRPAAIRDHVRGVLVNPNNELPLNFGPLHTLGAFMRSGPDFDPRAAYLWAMRDWLPAFTLLPRGAEPRPAITADEVILLGDCFYLPHEHGAEARRLLETTGRLLAAPGRREQDADLRRTASGLIALTNRLADLQDRGLAHAMARRLWALRDELTLLLVRLDAAAGRPRPDDDHLPGTFRGGFVADLRRLLPFDPGPSLAGVREFRPRPAILRPARGDDLAGCSRVCLETGDHGADGTPFYAEDPDALARIYVAPYLALEPDLSFVLEDEQGVCGYVLAAVDSRSFYARYDSELRPQLVAAFSEPAGDPATWTRAQHVHRSYHHPDYHCPEPAAEYPAHAHIDLAPRAQGLGYGGPMMRHILAELARRGAPGVHLGVSGKNPRALAFYARLGFMELERRGPPDDQTVYLGLRLAAASSGAARP